MREDEADTSVSPLLPPAPASLRPNVWWWRLVAVVVAVDLAGLYLGLRPTPQSDTTAPRTELLGNLVRRDGRLYLKEATNVFTGWMITRYADGTMKSRAFVSNGLLDGVSEGWFATGVRQVEEHFADGVGEGPVTQWREDGSKLSEGVAHLGKLEGVFRRWHTNGILAEEIQMAAGKPDGISRAWHPDGQLKAQVTLHQGQVVNQEFHEANLHEVRTNLLSQGGDE